MVGPWMQTVFLVVVGSSWPFEAYGEFEYEMAVPACAQREGLALLSEDSLGGSCAGARRGEIDEVAAEVLMLLETDAGCGDVDYQGLSEPPLDSVPVAVATCALPAVLTFQIFAAAASLRTACRSGTTACDAEPALDLIRASYSNFRARMPSMIASIDAPAEVAGTVRRYALEEAESMGKDIRQLWTREALATWAANPAALAGAALNACSNIGLSRRVLYWRANTLLGIVSFGLASYLSLVAPRSEFLHSRQEVLMMLLGGPPADGQKLVEVGVHLARVAFGLLGTMQGLQYIGVDPYVYDSELTSAESTAKQLADLGLSPDAEGGEGARELSTEVRKAAEYKLSFFAGRAELLVLPSVEAASRLPDASVDGVFIDGDHSYAQVVRDIAAWEPKVKPGGFLSGHDFGNTLDVARAVLERAAATNRTVHLAMDWVWYYYV
ncbi:unnamed protein product [Polarella glacialis]|uniref:Uncharacterized protein n=1 Tax=Polarella glacialis TaxID=89957 RepID=A0A813LAC1_POLGL|nr:unnamed protein product [Polarella glacialis]